MKRINALRGLSSEHHRALVIAKKALQATTESQVQIWLLLEEFYQQELCPHFAVEERAFVSELQRLGYQKIAQRLLQEHQLLHDFFKQDSARDLAQLQQFASLLKQHVAFEERELFELVQTNFDLEKLPILSS